MSRSLGDRLPDEVVAAFDGSDLDHKLGLAFPLVTVDADGTPRTCLLSMGEVLAVDHRQLRFLLWSGTRTARNLRESRSALLTYLGPDAVYHIRGLAKVLPGSDRAERFALDVGSVETDRHAGMPVVDTIRFEVTSDRRGDVLRTWRDQLDELRRA
jgi:hypothetical protein